MNSAQLPAQRRRLFSTCPAALMSIVVLLLFSVAPVSPKEEPCQLCKHLVKMVMKGIDKTDKKNFDGGNPAWEKKKLLTYKNSETRLVEITETLCEKGDFECYKVLEQCDEHLETWWFEGKDNGSDLFQWMCMDGIKACCPNGTFGPECKECLGGSTRPCYGNGRCLGDGTRWGSGLCKCNPGYGGFFCASCTEGYFMEHRNETHVVCKECYSSCTKCTGAEDYECVLCKQGYELYHNRCMDIDECDRGFAQCSADQYCANTEGSFECRACDKACVGCKGAGRINCKKCNTGYIRDGTRCVDIDECSTQENICSGEKQLCENSEGGYFCICEQGYVPQDGKCVEDQPVVTPEKGLFDDITDDEVVVLQQMFFGVIICALATLAAKGDMVFTAIFIGAIAAMGGYWMSERGDRVLDGFLKGR